jgi:hypothetical protein
LFLLLITQFLYFSWLEVSLSRGLCCSGSGLSVEELRYREAHLVRVFPSRMGAGHWWPQGGPPRFSIQHEVEIFCTGWRCGGVKVMPFLSDYACKVCLQRLSKISL